MSGDLLDQLVSMSNHLGDPANDYAILGEGNASARIDDENYWITASGTSLRTVGRDEFLRINFDRAVALRDDESLNDEQVRLGLLGSRVVSDTDKLPSTETAIHATCLQLDGVNFVGHTHPTAINSITCSVHFEESIRGRLFPDEIVVCGRVPVVIPYVDPGMPLARAIKVRLDAYLDEFSERPRIMLLQNHGFFAFGSTAQEVLDITAMAVKTARILVGTYAAGGPNFLSPEHVQRIHTRPDEIYRKRIIGLS